MKKKYEKNTHDVTKNENGLTQMIPMGKFIRHIMSLVLRKPVFGVSDQVPHKPGCTTTQHG